MDEKWATLAEELSNNSTDPNIKVGCVLVKDDELISEGWNRIINGVEDIEDRYSRPAKFFWIEHAERIAVYNAARNGICTEGATAYVNVSPCSVCTQCLRGLIECGITRIVGNTRKIEHTGKIKTHATVNEKMIEEAEIEIIIME